MFLLIYLLIILSDFNYSELHYPISKNEHYNNVKK